jgi:A/G-specific adenine glycosylase
MSAEPQSRVADDNHRWLHRDQALSLGLPAPIRTLLTAPEQTTLL